MAKIKKTTLYVKGMHCPSCEVLITDKFKEENNIKTINPNFSKQKVELSYTGRLDEKILNKKIQPFGYEIISHNEEKLEESLDSLPKRIFEAAAIAVIIILLYLSAKELSLVPSFNFKGSLNYLTVFFIGLIASTSTCMATSGALFLSTVGKNKNNFIQALAFNFGRIISYGFFGFIVGAIGQTLLTTFKIGPWLTFLSAIFMILLGLDMARVIVFAKIIPYGKTKGIFEKLENLLIKNPKKTAFFLGAITYLLPCGFTQAVQVYSLGLASPVQSALTMVVFAIGTVPAILLIGSIGSLTKSKFYPYFLKTMGMLVFIIGVYYFNNFLSLYGVNLNLFGNGAGVYNSAAIKDGVQTINMRVVTSGYIPNYFSVKKGIPVRWVIKGENVFGCQGYLVVPKLGISKALETGDNIFNFTPTESGFINFSCSMGMYRGRIEVI